MQGKVLIIAAMEDVELGYIKEKVEDLKRIEYKGFKFYEGKIFKRQVVICVSNIGLINAATALTVCIERFNPTVIVNVGLAGGYTKDLHRGKVVIGTDAINITSMEYKGSGNTLEDYEITTFLHAENNRLVREIANKELIDVIKEKFRDSGFVFGTIGSGDIWNKNKERIAYINKRYGAICEDMESIAIYRVANLYGIPTVCIKGISNNEVTEEAYDEYEGEHVQKVALDVINVLFS